MSSVNFLHSPTVNKSNLLISVTPASILKLCFGILPFTNSLHLRKETARM